MTETVLIISLSVELARLLGPFLDSGCYRCSQSSRVVASRGKKTSLVARAFLSPIHTHPNGTAHAVRDDTRLRAAEVPSASKILFI